MYMMNAMRRGAKDRPLKRLVMIQRNFLFLCYLQLENVTRKDWLKTEVLVPEDFSLRWSSEG